VTKISEMSADGFSQATREALSQLINTALSSKVPIEDVNAIIADVYGQAGGFTLQRGLNKVRSAIENKIRAANAETLTGIIVGSRDAVGKQFPVKYSFVAKNGKHLEVSSFSPKVPYQGSEIDIPVPAAVIIKAEYDPSYDSWQMVSIEKYQSLSKEQLVKVLAGVAIPISAINGDFAYHKTNDDTVVSSRVVVIAGKISRMTSEAVRVFEDHEDGTTTSRVDHYLPVMCGREMNAKEELPCIQFLLNSTTRGTNSVRCHLSQQRKGTPTVLVDDFVTACQQAVAKIKDPEAQAADVGEWMKECPVIIVGPVQRYNRSTGQDKSEQNWVDIGVSFIIDAEGFEVDGKGAQTKLTNEPRQTATPPTHTTDSQPVAGPITSSKPQAEKKTRKPKEPAVAPVVATPPPATPPVSEGGEDLMADFDVQEAADKVFPAPAGTSTQPPAVQAPPATPAAAASTAAGTVPPKILNLARNIQMYCQLMDIAPKDVAPAELKSKAADIVTLEGQVLPDSIIQMAIEYLAKGGKV
jgi:hypothetical protein